MDECRHEGINSSEPGSDYSRGIGWRCTGTASAASHRPWPAPSPAASRTRPHSHAPSRRQHRSAVCCHGLSSSLPGLCTCWHQEITWNSTAHILACARLCLRGPSTSDVVVHCRQAFSSTWPCQPGWYPFFSLLSEVLLAGHSVNVTHITNGKCSRYYMRC